MKFLILTTLLITASISYGQQIQSSIVIEEVEPGKITVSNSLELTNAVVTDEGTNDPVSTGATRFEVNGKVFYTKEFPQLRIVQTNNAD